jgi:hypothetical protein
MKTDSYKRISKRKTLYTQDPITWHGKESLWGNASNTHKELPNDSDWVIVDGETLRIFQPKEISAELILNSMNTVGYKSLSGEKSATSTQALWHEATYLGSLNNSFSILIKEITESKYILNQKLDWEIENSPLYSLESWLRAIKFIIKYANHVFFKEKQCILTPKIYHGPENSIDIYWDYSHLNMLLNVPILGEGSFSLDDNGSNKINGFFNPDEPTFKYLPLAF